MRFVEPKSGDLRLRVFVKRLKDDAALDAAGKVDESEPANWETHFECWSEFAPVGSAEFFGGREVQAGVTGQFHLRACSETRAITSDMRVYAKNDSRVWNVAGKPFDPNGRRAWVYFNATETD